MHERSHPKISFDRTEGRTQQSQAAGTDITALVNKYIRTGQTEHMSKAAAITGEFANIGDYQAAMERGKIAQENFDGMPSRIRSRFDNDPGIFVDFMSAAGEGEVNFDEAVQLELIPAPAPDPTPPPDPAPDPPREPEA